MFAATISPWYLPTCVSSRTPVASPPARAQVRVNRDAPRAGRHADRVQALGQPQASARPYEQAVAAQLVAVFKGQDVVLAVAPGGGHAHAQEELDAVAAQHLAERVAQRLGLAGQHVAGAL